MANLPALGFGLSSANQAPFLCSVPLLSEPPPGPGLEPAEGAVHLLIIALPHAPGGSREALVFPREEQMAWLERAAQRGSSLVALLTERSIELYSTESDRTKAFRPVLESLAARMKSVPVLAKARTVTKSGVDAARHLLRRASGLGGELLDDQRLISQLHTATALSASSAALGSNLGSLFRAAVSVGRRVRQETALGDPNATTALREVEQLSAERIMEEELAAWQTQEAELTRVVELAEFHALLAQANDASADEALRAVEQTGVRIRRPATLFGDEPGSMVRLRAECDLASSALGT